MAIERASIVQLARGFIGVRWRHQGRTPENGVDCVGLAVMVGQLLHLWTPLPAQYPRRPDGSFISMFSRYVEPIRPADKQDGDILIFAQGGHACHCGISSTYYGQPGVVHSHAGCRKVVEQTIESAIPTVGNVVALFKFPGVV